MGEEQRHSTFESQIALAGQQRGTMRREQAASLGKPRLVVIGERRRRGRQITTT